MRHLLQALCVLLLVSISAQGAEVRVYAAASLRTVLDEINPGRGVGVYAASPALARQIIEGAPADVFISADTAWMDELEQRGLLKPGTRRNLVGNRLVLIAPAGSGLRIELGSGVDLLTALGGGRLAIGETTAVPAGRYAKAALQSLGQWQALAPHLAEQINVRAALALVARGEAPLGIVYASDAHAENSVEIVGIFPESSHPAIIYPAAMIAASTNLEAEAYLEFLHSEKAQAVFARYGFTTLK